MATAKQLLDLAIQQLAAESYLDQYRYSNQDALANALFRGNNRLGFEPLGLTCLALAEATRRSNNLQILSHHANDAAGFSATLTRLRNADGTLGPYTLSFRSTEFRPTPDGDRERDIFGVSGFRRLPSAGADVEILQYGYAFGQIAAMEGYYRWLRATVIPPGEKLSVTGYSLGGHLATVFTLLHPSDILGTYTFNGPGIGGVGTQSTGVDLQRSVIALTGSFQAYLAANLGDGLQSLLLSGNPDNIYEYPQYWLARLLAQVPAHSVGTPSTPSVGLSDGPFALITNIVGRADHNDTTLVANAGYHSANQINIFIEDQPDWTGGGGVLGFSGDFGTTHSITLLIDSLALQSLFQELDPTLSREKIAIFLSLASNQTGAGLVNTADARVEGNSLELALDGLRQVFLGPSAQLVSTPFSTQDRGFGDINNRNAYFQNLVAVREAASPAVARGALSIVPMYGRSDTELTAAMNQAGPAGTAIRLALRSMTPIAVMGADLPQQNLSGELDPYDPTTRFGNLTSGWIQDRVDAFQAYLVRNRADADGAKLNKPLAPTAYVLVSGEGPDFDDTVLASGLGGFRSNGERKVIFGSAANDIDARSLVGSDLDDTIYGMEGDDRLVGGLGNDWLEGGAGYDTYVLSSDGNADTIFDTDGRGQLLVDDIPLTAGRRIGPNSYLSGDGAHQLSLAGDTLVIDGRTKVLGFRNGDLGLRFEDLPDTPLTLPDVEKYYIGGPLSDELVDEFGAALHAFGSPFADSYVGIDYDESGVTSEFFTWLGNDYTLEAGDAMVFLSKAGDDALSVYSMPGSRFHGGAGNDYIVANEPSNFHASVAPPVLVGGSGNDRIEGSSSAEFILGDFQKLALRPGGLVDLDIVRINSNPDGTFIGTYNASLGIDLQVAGGHGEQISLASLADYLDLAIGPDTEPGSGTGFDDVIDGGADDDIIAGGPGDDIIHGGDGDDWLGGDNQFDRPAGDPVSFQVDPQGFGALAYRFGYAGNDYIDGGGGNDQILDREAGNVPSGVTPTSVYSVLIGGPGDDTIVSEVQGAYIDGGNDSDTIFAYRGATVLGGTGDDSIDAVESWVDGGAGSDTYLIHSHLIQSHEGSAALTIRDADDPLSSDTILLSDLTWNGAAQWIAFDAGDPGSYPHDILDFIAAGGDPSAGDGPGTVGVDVLSTTVTPYREGDDLVLGIRTDAIEFTLLYGVDPILRVQDWFLGENYQVEAITFEGDGVTWTLDDVNAMVAEQEDDIPDLADLPELTYASFDFDPSAFDFDFSDQQAEPTELAGQEVLVTDVTLVTAEAPATLPDAQGDGDAKEIAFAEPPADRADSALRGTSDDVIASLASSQSEIAREVESFFARNQSEPLRESAWLDQWVLGGHGGARGESGSDGQGRTVEGREFPGPQEGMEAPASSPAPEDAPTPDEVAEQYERMHAWLDAHPGDDESVFAPDWSGRSSLFASLGTGIGSTTRQDYLIPAGTGLGAPLRGLSEGLQPLALA